MAGLVPAIHDLCASEKQDVDARDKPGHDEKKWDCDFFVIMTVARSGA